MNEEHQKYLEIQEDIRERMSTPVLLDHTQVIAVTVSELSSKFAAAVKRGDKEGERIFEDALKWYLTDEEFSSLVIKLGL